MAKKKSKTQKLKKNLKDKQKKQQKKILEQTEALKKISASGATKASVAKQNPVIKEKKKVTKENKKTIVPKDKIDYNVVINKNKKDISKKEEKNLSVKPKKVEKTTKEVSKPKKNVELPKLKEKEKAKELVNKKDVIYNVPLTRPKKPKTTSNFDLQKIWKALIASIAIIFKKIIDGIKNHFQKRKTKKVEKLAERELQIKIDESSTKIELTEDEVEDKEAIKERKRKEKQEAIKKKNFLVRLFYSIVYNRHVFFNAILIFFFIILLIGLIRIEVVSKGTIMYVCLIAVFLMAVAISYNRYLSGKIYSILLCVIMGFAIYRIDYTYDFIRNMNSAVYEYKTYYVVTFNNSQNKSIYNINNKKIGLLNENTTNIERKLNTKLDKVNYIEYDNLNDLFNDFYDQHFRAVLVNENQYKYMKNHIDENARDVKILYEFKANAKK